MVPPYACRRCDSRIPVSYTHLDVYKRQDLDGVEDAHLDHVAPLAVGRVETLAGGQLGDLVDHDSALKALSLIHI